MRSLSYVDEKEWVGYSRLGFSLVTSSEHCRSGNVRNVSQSHDRWAFAIDSLTMSMNFPCWQ